MHVEPLSNLASCIVFQSESAELCYFANGVFIIAAFVRLLCSLAPLLPSALAFASFAR